MKTKSTIFVLLLLAATLLFSYKFITFSGDGGSNNAGNTYQNTPLTDNDLNSLLWGLGVTASGGGGGFGFGQILIDKMKNIDPSKRVLKPVSSVTDDDYIVVAGGIGKPDVLTPENISKFVGYIKNAIQEWEKLEASKTGKPVKVKGIMPVEAGPVNGLIAMYVGFQLGLDVYDCDGAGRAVPSLNNLLYDYTGNPIAPVVLSGEVSGKSLTVEVTNSQGIPPNNGTEAEQEIVTYPFFDESKGGGGAAGFVAWGMTGRELKNANLVQGTFSELIPIGEKLAELSYTPDSFLQYLNDTYYLVKEGVLQDITKSPDPRHDFNTIKIQNNKPVQNEVTLNENENILYVAGVGIIIQTIPTIEAFFFWDKDINRYMPYNLGDPALIKNLQKFINQPVITVGALASSKLFEGGIANSFHNLLASDPYKYSGDFIPNHGK